MVEIREIIKFSLQAVGRDFFLFVIVSARLPTPTTQRSTMDDITTTLDNLAQAYDAIAFEHKRDVQHQISGIISYCLREHRKRTGKQANSTNVYLVGKDNYNPQKVTNLENGTAMPRASDVLLLLGYLQGNRSLFFRDLAKYTNYALTNKLFGAVEDEGFPVDVIEHYNDKADGFDGAQSDLFRT